MEKVEVYSEAKSIVDLCNNYICDPLNLDHEKWLKTYNILRFKSELIIDSKDTLIKHLKNDFVKHLIKSSTSGGSKIYEMNDYINSLKSQNILLSETNNKSPFFLLEELDTESLQNKFGVSINDGKNGIRLGGEILSQNKSIIVSKNNKLNQLKTWNDLFQNIPPLNSLVICDNYFLDKPKTYQNNLFKILDLCIPRELIVPFHLCIISRRELLNPQKKYDEISSFLSSLNIEFEFELHLTDTNKPHSRTIASNYFYIQSDHSFDIYNDKGNVQKELILSYLPICGQTSIDWFHRILSQLAKYTATSEVIGIRNNRLLEYY